MSLFSARTWWSVPGASTDAFDRGALCVANIDNADDNQAKLIVGSFSGFLRIYQPSTRGFSPEDLRLEVRGKEAVLQVAAGRFHPSGGPNALHLAVLHPRSLVVYSVSDLRKTNAGQGLTVLYRHELRRTAACLVHGRFGNQGDLDMLCVQSMDGALAFFTQERFAFERFLPNFLVPGPLCYLPATDTFVTCNAACIVEAYKYMVLASATARDERADDDDDASADDKSGSGKKVQADWTFNLGEHAVEMKVLPDEPHSIVVLGERSIVWLDQLGVMQASQRLQREPACLHIQKTLEGRHNILVAAHDSSLMVLRDNKMIWAAQMDCIPVAVRVCKLGGSEGMIVALDDTGKLSCYYLGTDPKMPVIPASAQRDVDYDHIDQEIRQLQRTIRNNVLGGVMMAPIQGEGGLPVSTVAVRLAYLGEGSLRNITVNIHTPPPLVAEPPTAVIPVVEGDGAAPTSFMFAVRLDPGTVPSSTRLSVSVAYVSRDDEPRCITHPVELPLRCVCLPAAPAKTAKYKVTVGANQPLTDLPKIFDDLLRKKHINPNAVGLQVNAGGPLVTVLASKSTGRYRLQSDHLEAINVVMEGLIARLQVLHRNAHPPLVVNFIDPAPRAMVSSVGNYIEQHFKFRKALAELKQMLATRTQQFRVGEKRLLARFKDKTPSPLQNLDDFLYANYSKIMTLAEDIDATRLGLELASARLACALELLLSAMRIHHHLDDEQVQLLRGVLCPGLPESSHGWEEAADAGLAHLIKVVLAGSSKRDAIVNPPALEMPPDASSVRKHLAQLCDRLAKGAALPRSVVPAAPPPQSPGSAAAASEAADASFAASLP